MRIRPNLIESHDGRQAAIFSPRQLSSQSPRRSAQGGFTLVEIIVVIAIVGILAAVAVPAFASWRERQAVESAAQSLYSHLKQARVLALAENRSVKIAFQNSAYTFDKDTTGNCKTCKNEKVDLTQFSNRITVKSSKGDITFTSRGTATNTTVTLTVGQSSRKVKVNIIGRAYRQ